MRLRSLLLFALLATLPGAANAATVFDQRADAQSLSVALAPVIKDLQSAQTLRGRYQQRKTMRELPRPLLADGSFLFVRDLGLVWRTETPFVSELIITRDALVHRDGGGASVRVGVEQQPAIRMVGSIFFAVFSLDFATLERLFRLSGGAQSGGGWAIGLQPLQNAGSMRDIEVRGAAQVQRVILHETGGDVTEIELRDTVASTTPATAAERALFLP